LPIAEAHYNNVTMNFHVLVKVFKSYL